MFGENRNAATEMMEKYDPDLMGKIAFNITGLIKLYINSMKRQNLCTRQFLTSIMPNLI